MQYHLYGWKMYCKQFDKKRKSTKLNPIYFIAPNTVMLYCTNFKSPSHVTMCYMYFSSDIYILEISQGFPEQRDERRNVNEIHTSTTLWCQRENLGQYLCRLQIGCNCSMLLFYRDLSVQVACYTFLTSRRGNARTDDRR